MSIRVGINGCGRIGRAMIRAWLSDMHRDRFTLVLINDLAPLETIQHLLTYDSVFGKISHRVDIENDHLLIDGQRIDVTCQADPSTCSWGDHGIDVLFECSGRFVSKHLCQGHLSAGAPRVLISAPAKGNDVDATVVYGVNHDTLTLAHKVVSNASCTTNCLAPMIKPLHEAFEITSGLMNTIHAYTGDQRLNDATHDDLRRARAAGVSMIPTSTGAAKAIGLVIPDLAGKVDGLAVRVPTINVSMVDLSFRSAQSPSVEAITQCLTQASESSMLFGVLEVNDKPLVSVDFVANAHSCIVDLPQVRVIDDMAKVIAWYDNEWAFANRMFDTAAAWMESN